MANPSNKLFSVPESVAPDRGSPLAGRVCQKTIYELVKAGRMPGVVRIGKRVFLTEDGMNEFIAKGGSK